MKPRTYTYRIPLDDRSAFRKIHALQRLNADYHIFEVPKRDVPNWDAARHWDFKFYASRETIDHSTQGRKGGTIPGLSEYRYSLDWEEFPGNFPGSINMEMKNHQKGGTKLRGTVNVGTSDPRLPDAPHIETHVGLTPTELKRLFNDNEAVPNKFEYTTNPPKIEPGEAQDRLCKLLDRVAHDKLDELEEQLIEYMEQCTHDHVLSTERQYGCVAYCEDCGKGFDEYDVEHENITVQETTVVTT